jgi:hypothetical protein
MLGVMMLLLPQSVSGAVEHLYIEEITGYHRFNGETMRIDQKREFAIQDYFLYNVSDDYFANVTMIDDSQNGVVHLVQEEVRKINFIPTASFWPNGSLFNVDWEFNIFRIPKPFSNPFEADISPLFFDSRLGHRRFDQFVESNYFSLALEHFEFHMIEGEMVKLRVNTEFATDNHEDGRSYKTALHIIKRTPDGTILYDYNYSSKEANRIYDFFNLFDQPFFWVPVRLGAVFALVYLYMRVVRWYESGAIKIVRGIVEDTGEVEIGKEDTSEE